MMIYSGENVFVDLFKQNSRLSFLAKWKVRVNMNCICLVNYMLGVDKKYHVSVYMYVHACMYVCM